jgi:hypothetical protein
MDHKIAFAQVHHSERPEDDMKAGTWSLRDRAPATSWAWRADGHHPFSLASPQDCS